VFRLDFISPKRLAQSNRHGAGVHVSILPVRTLLQLGLTIIAKPMPEEPPGHAIIPEMNFPRYQTNKDKVKELSIELAKVATKIYGPTPPKNRTQ